MTDQHKAIHDILDGCYDAEHLTIRTNYVEDHPMPHQITLRSIRIDDLNHSLGQVCYRLMKANLAFEITKKCAGTVRAYVQVSNPT